MYNLLKQLYIENKLSGGIPYIACHPELGVPIGIFNSKDEPTYKSRLKSIKKMGKKGNNLSFLLAKYFSVKNIIPSFAKDDNLSPEDMRKLIKDLKSANDKLRDSQQQYNNDLMDSADNWKSINEYIKESSNVMVGYVNMIQNTGQQMAAFTLNTRQQYEVSEKIAEQYKETSLNLGLNVKQGKMLSETFKKASVFVERYGMEVSDLKEIYTALADTSGRIQFLTTDELNNLAMMTKAFKMSTQDAGEISDRFQLMGINIENGFNYLSDTFADARAMGLNSQKVISTLEENFASMQRMSFRGGVKGMTQMAKLATEMRVSVSSMLGMAEKFYNPENAIEAVAELQLMGGDVAAAFGDPFEVMYLARNKPEELAERVKDMTSNMAQFNEATGQYELPAEAIQQLTFMADKIGYGKDEMIDMAYQSSKLKDVKEAFAGSTMFNEDEQSAIAQMAQFKDGEWRVTVGDEELSLDDQKLKEAVESGMLIAEDKEPLEEMVDASFTTNQLLTNILEEFKTGVAIRTDFYEIGERLMQESVDAISEGTKESLENISKEIKKSEDGSGKNVVFNQVFNPENQKKVGEQMATSVENMFAYMNAAIKGEGDVLFLNNLNNVLETIRSFNTELGQSQPGGGGEGNEQPADDFLSRNNGGHSRFTTKDDVLGAKKGGVIDKLLNAALGGYNTGGNAGVNSNVNVNGEITIKSSDGKPISNLTAEQLRPIIMEQLNGGAGIPTSNREKMTGTV